MLLNYDCGENCWEQPWTTKKSHPKLDEVKPDCSLEALIRNLMLKYFGHIKKAANTGEDPDAWKNKDNKKEASERHGV